MKRILLSIAFLACFAASAFAQSGNVPITIREVDGSPRITNPSGIIVSNGTLTVSGTTATIVTGGGGGGGTPGGSNGNVQFNSVGNFGGVAGFNFNGTSAITLGVAGASVGSVGFRNATSGTVTLQPVTGALGTVTLSLPARTATVATTTGTLTSGRCAEFDASGNLVQASAGCLAVAGTTNSLQTNNGGGALDGSATVLADLTTATIILGDLGVQNGRLQLRNSTNSNVTNLISGAPSSSLTFTLPATLPASAGCLEVSSTGVITQTGSACGSGGGSQTPWTSNIDADGFNLLFDDGTGIKSSEAGNANLLLFTSVASGVNNFRITNAATATKPVVILESEGSDAASSIHIKAKAGTYPNSGQVFFNSSVRYDEPSIAFYDVNSATYISGVGIGMKAGGSWLSMIAPNIMLGAGDGTPGTVGITGNSYLAWNVNNTAAEDCPACVAVGFNKPAQRVIGVVGADSTPDGDLTNGATFGFIANTPAQITSNQDNYDPGQPSYFQRWSTDASRNVTGMTFAISTKVSGQAHRIWNVGSFNIVLVNEATSTAANQFKTSTGADITVAPKECADVQYDAAQSRWLTTPCATAGGGSGTVTSVAQSFTGGLISVGGSPVTTSGTLALTVAGTSGGIPYFSSASTWASSAALTANLPVIGGGAGAAPSVGTVSGNTTTFVTTTGAQTSGRCVEIDASGNHVASSGACGGSGSQTPWTSNIDADGFNLLMDDSTGILSSETSNPQILLFSSVASAVNELTITNAATGNRPNIAASGDDTNIGITVTPKGTGATVLASGNLNFGGVAAGNVMFKPNGTGGAFRRGDDSNLSGFIDAGTWAAGTAGAYKAIIDAGNTAAGIFLSSDGTFYFSSSTSANGGLNDLSLVRAGTNTLRVGRGTTAGVGFVNMGRAVTAKTSGYSVVVNDSNTFFTNTGAGGSVTFTLPTPVVGMMYEFYRDANQTVVIDVSTGVTIQVGASTTTSGGDVTLDAVGSSIRITAISTTQWVGSSVGTLTFN